MHKLDWSFKGVSSGFKKRFQYLGKGRMTSLIFVKAKTEEKHNKIVILSFAQFKTNFVHFGGLQNFKN